jgi:hypothetical protein
MTTSTVAVFDIPVIRHTHTISAYQIKIKQENDVLLHVEVSNILGSALSEFPNEAMIRGLNRRRSTDAEYERLQLNTSGLLLLMLIINSYCTIVTDPG